MLPNNITSYFRTVPIEVLKKQIQFQAELLENLLLILEERNIKETYQCLICNEIFEDFSLLRSHLQVMHPDVNPGDGNAIKVIRK